MKHLLVLLLVVLGCSAADSEEVGQLEQALTPCTLALKGPFVAGTGLTWEVKNIGQPCTAANDAYTELYTFCSTCSVGSGRQRVSHFKQGFTMPAAGLPGWRRHFARSKPSPCTSIDTANVLVSWIPAPGAARQYDHNKLTCPL